MNNKENLQSGNWREVLGIAIPLVITGSAFTIMQFCDRMFLSKYSSLALGAALPAGNLSFAMISLFAAISGFSTSFVAQYYGVGDRRSCITAAVHGVYFSLMCIPIFLIMIPIGQVIIDFFDHSPELVEQEMIYFKWMLAGGALVGAGWSIGGYFTGQSRLIPNIIANVIGCIVNIYLDYAMIFGKHGFPEMGIRGAAIATFISSAFAPVIQFLWMLRDKQARDLGLRGVFRFDPKFMVRLIKYGFPAGMQMLMDIGSFTYFVLMTASLDLLQLTASNIAFSINNLAFSPLMSFGNAASIIAGQYQGRGDSVSCRRAGWSGIKIGWVYMSFMAILFIFFPETLMNVFRQNNVDPEKVLFSVDEMMSVCRRLMIVMTVWGFFDVANIVMFSALKGVGDTRFVMWLMGILSWCLWIPGEYYIFKSGFGIVAGWAWLAIFIAILATCCALRWRSNAWTHINLVRETN